MFIKSLVATQARGVYGSGRLAFDIFIRFSIIYHLSIFAMAFEKPLATPIIIPSVFLPFAILAVVARFYARHVRNAGLKIDDWMLLPCLVNPQFLFYEFKVPKATMV